MSNGCSSVCWEVWRFPLGCLCPFLKDRLTVFAWGSTLFRGSLVYSFTALVPVTSELVSKPNNVRPPTLLFSIVSRILGPLPCELENRFDDIYTATGWHSGWGSSEPLDDVGKNLLLNNIESFFPWTWGISPFIYFFDIFHQSCIVFSTESPSCTYFVRFAPKYFILGGSVVTDTIFLTSKFNCSLLECRKATDFCILTRYPVSLL